MAYKLLPSYRAGSTAETPKLWENVFASISTALFSWVIGWTECTSLALMARPGTTRSSRSHNSRQPFYGATDF